MSICDIKIIDGHRYIIARMGYFVIKQVHPQEIGYVASRGTGG